MGVVYVTLCLLFWVGLEVMSAERPVVREGDTCQEINGTRWFCKDIADCPSALRILKESSGYQEFRKNIHFCNSRSPPSDNLFCCDPEVKTSPIGRKAKEMCKTYADAVYVKIPNPVIEGESAIFDTCPITAEPLTTGSNGENAEYREFPHMALIGFGNASSIDWLCGGSLISDRFVLSAAHCSVSGRGDAKWVRLGDYNFRSKEDEKNGQSKSVEHEIVERINHPDYSTSAYYNDIALYKLNSTVVFNEFIRPLCLHTEYLEPEGEYTATGWGVLEWGGKQSDILQKMKLLISSKQECKEAYNITIGAKLKDGIKDESMFCAGDVQRGRDTCPGDSGGPLQVLHPKLYCMYLQLGITSFGSLCAGNRPGVYTRVFHFIPWIESVVWPENGTLSS